MAKVLVVSGGRVGLEMAGPGVRALAFARALAAQNEVTLAAPQLDDLGRTGFACLAYDKDAANLQEATARADVVIAQGMVPYLHPCVLDPGRILVLDLYDPSFFENLVGFSHQADREHQFQVGLDVYREQLLAGDFFLCANERQRDLWLGMLLALGRVNHLTCGIDPTLRSLIDIVPFGLPERPPQPASGPVLKGVHPSIGPDDKVVLWGGGIWPWLDPLLAIDAMAALPTERKDIKLVFLSATLFGGQLPSTGVVQQVRERIHALGLDSRVILNEHWVPYEERGHYLLEADAGIIAHRPNLETYYSNRTRILDYLWAGLPVVTVTGDVWSEIVAREGLGCAVPPSPEALAQGIIQVLDTPRDRYREALAGMARRYTWTQTTDPLCRFCLHPVKAADHDPAERARWQQALQGSAMQREKELLEALAWHRLPLRRKLARRLRKEMARFGLGTPPPDLVQPS
jgi:glycosyltransferase involved in cell wall biosynthesis